MNEWAGKPLPISATCFTDGELTVRLSGAEPAVRSARQKLGGEEIAESEAFWVSVREQTHPFFNRAGSFGACRSNRRVGHFRCPENN